MDRKGIRRTTLGIGPRSSAHQHRVQAESPHTLRSRVVHRANHPGGLAVQLVPHSLQAAAYSLGVSSA